MTGNVLSSFIRRLAMAREIYGLGGWTAVAERTFPLIGYHRIVILESRLTPPAPVPPAGVALEFAFIGHEGQEEIVAFRPELPLTEINGRFAREERCFVARHEGEIVCAYWIHRSTVSFPEVGYKLAVPADAVYVFDAFTSPRMRGQRIAPALSRELKNRLAAEGFERWMLYVRGGNRSGLNNARRGGAREVTRVAAFRFRTRPPVRVGYFPR